jgi:hypothetical protein
MRDPDLRYRRAAHNHALFQEVTHGLRAVHDEIDGVIRIEHVFSECLGPNCRDHVVLTSDDYEVVREEPTRFASTWPTRRSYQPTRGGAQ